MSGSAASATKPYLSAGAGLREPSGPVRAFRHAIDDSRHIPDVLALEERERFARREGLSLGVTSGMALAVGIRLARERPDDEIVVIAPDGGEHYAEWPLRVPASRRRLLVFLRVSAGTTYPVGDAFRWDWSL